MKKRALQRWIVNLGLLVAVIALLLLGTINDQPVDNSPKLLSDFLPAEITRIRIDKPGKKSTSFQLEGNSWMMNEPYTLRADSGMVKRLVAIGQLPVSSIIQVGDIEMDAIGLVQPLATVTFNDVTIAFGDPQPVGQLRYIGLGNQVMLVADQHIGQLKSGSITYVDRHLVPEGKDIAELVIDTNTIDLTTDTNIVDQWLAMKASWLSHSAEVPETATDIHITLQDGSKIHYLAERRENDVVLTNPDIQFEYHLPFTALETLAINLPATDETADDAAATRQEK
jgi:hypothetical protein